MRESIAAVILLSIAIGSSAAAKRTGNAPFVVAFEEQSPFYARCLPDEKRGSKGTTQIVRVRANGDEVITTYSWYNRNGLVLGWSPKAGKVAVMRVRQDEGLPPEKQVEFSFYLGDQYLQSFTTADLVKLGAGIKRDAAAFEGGLSVSSKRAEYRVEGCKQVVGTNDYYFTVRLDDTRTLSFDILTGTLCRIEKDGSKQRLVPVVFQYSVERSCGFSIVRTQQTAKTLAAARPTRPSWTGPRRHGRKHALWVGGHSPLLPRAPQALTRGAIQCPCRGGQRSAAWPQPLQELLRG